MSVFQGDPLLLKTLVFLLLAVVLPIAGIMAAGGAVALCCDLFGRRNDSEAHRRLAAALLERVVPGHGAWILLPLGFALALLGQWLIYGLPNALLSFWGAALVLLLAGGGVLRITRHLLSRSTAGVLAFGGAGVLLMTGALYLLLVSQSLIQRPDQLVWLSRLPENIISWHGTWRFLTFTALSMAASGALLRWRGPRWTGDADPGRRGGVFLLGAGLLLLPVLILLELLMSAPFALSPAIFVLAAIAVVQAAVVFLLLATRRGVRGIAFALTALIFPVWILMGHFGREEAQAGPVVAGFAALADIPPIGLPAVAVPVRPDREVVDGEAVFKRVCAACHQFDRRVVGPPLNDVVPKYREDLQGLMDFIRDPVPVNPDYPPMPRLGLSDAEIEAVAKWLQERVEE